MLYTNKDILLYSNPQGKDKQIIDINSPDLKKNNEINRRYLFYLFRLDHVKVLLRKLARPGGPENQQEDLLTIEPLRS